MGRGRKTTDYNRFSKVRLGEHVFRKGKSGQLLWLSKPLQIGKVRDALTLIQQGGEHRTKRRYLSLLLESIAVRGEEVRLTARNEAVLAMLEHGEKLDDKTERELCLSVRNGSPFRIPRITLVTRLASSAGVNESQSPVFQPSTKASAAKRRMNP
jgi:hypothetical protein